MQRLILFSEIGPGWIPAIIISETEYKFIVENQKVLPNSHSYWIGGATRTIGKIEYLHYLPYQIGAGKMSLFWKFDAWFTSASKKHLFATMISVVILFLLQQMYRHCEKSTWM